jgi:RimJ/RimL family protein N-acetyltransferase
VCALKSLRLTTTFSTLPETTAWIQTVITRPTHSIFSISISLQTPSDTHDDKETEIIGLIGLNPHDRLLYSIHPDFWGKGYCTEALRPFLKHLFEMQTEREVLVAGVHDGNDRSVRVLLKCGFVRKEGWESAMGGGEAGSRAASSHDNFSWFQFERSMIPKE